jgi:hypothetical protein
MCFEVLNGELAFGIVIHSSQATAEELLIS